MANLSLSKIAKDVGFVLRKHGPEILTGFGIAGMITTTVLAVKVTPKALKLMDEAKQRKIEENEDGVLTPVEVVKETWKCYIPAAVTGVASVACLVGASSVHIRRNAALATAYKLSETALTEYKEKVVETIGERKEKKIREEVAKDKLDKNPVTKQEVIITERGNTLCLDTLSKRYFKSDINEIKKAENELNKELLHNMYISLNEFYDKLGLSHTSIGDDLGWNCDNGLVELDLSSLIAEDGTPCLVIGYSIAPRYDYSKLI